MATYQDMKRQIAELQRKAAMKKKAEQSKVVAGIKKQIAEWDLTPEELFGDAAKRAAAKPKGAARSANPPKYRDPKSGATWTGIGRAPAWIVDAISKGRKDDFLIAPAGKAPAAKIEKVRTPVAKAAAAKAPAAKTPAARKAGTAKKKAPAKTRAKAAAPAATPAAS